ncbi:hypothetical protein L3Q82_018670 [Scortum barcoo]|uniref:Uncharacterized protein n=1 Tax=Scortum barcoo TaxID=214431 RepID=A0ACB8VF21_9TELE|nr:hypothetical protein L3Q82_018670 [Scortum barcoo]
MGGQTPAWHVPPLEKILPVAVKGWTERQHRGANHGSTRAGSEHKSDRSWGLPHQVVENDHAKILWDFQINKQVLANQPGIVVWDKEHKRAVVIEVAIPSDSNIRKKEHKTL